MAALDANVRLVSSGMWKWLQGTGMERFELLHGADQWILRGVILAMANESAAEARYELICDATFHTRHAEVSIRTSTGDRRLQISAENGIWHVNGRENPGVRGALDIDLGWSPSTNTLPIRRLSLQTGKSSGDFTAAWVRFPELTVEPLPQEYLRISDRLYRYSSRGGAFTAELLVDDAGLVLDYQGFWQRVPGQS